MRVDNPSLIEREWLWRSESIPARGWQWSLFVHGGRALSVPVLELDARQRPDVVEPLCVIFDMEAQ